MRKTLIVALIAACGVGGEAYAQKDKLSTVNIALTRQYEYSTNFTGGKLTWKTKSAKIATKDVIAAMSSALFEGNIRFSSSAQLVVAEGDFSGFFANWYDIQGSSVVGLPNGYHRVMQLENAAGDDWFTVGEYPAGLWQINGQLFVKDGAACINVTPFFKLMIQECYDCFYLNSFITDSTFTLGKQEGPPCCSPTFTLNGKGTDKYYITWTFDNTENNCAIYQYYNDYLGWSDVYGVDPYEDGVTPNDEPFYQSFDTRTMRWALNGIVTYKWNLKNFNNGDPFPRFLGSATYDANGYGFIAKVCAMITGKISVAEKLVDATQCCYIDWSEDGILFDDPWRDDYDWPDEGGIWRMNFNGDNFDVYQWYEYDEWFYTDVADKYVTDHWDWYYWYDYCDDNGSSE